jgi:predicted CoA-binding protein
MRNASLPTIHYPPSALHHPSDNSTMTVAVVGASSDRSKFGNKALRAFREEGHTVFAINPNEEMVEGMQTYASVLDVPVPIDMATVYVQPEVGESLLPEFEEKQIPEIWINPGAESDRLMAEGSRRKLNLIYACSIVGIGRSPSQF